MRAAHRRSRSRGGSSVSINEVRDQFNRQLEGIQRQTGQRPEPEQALRFGLHVRALEEVIQRAVLDYSIQQFGLVVSDAEAMAAMAAAFRHLKLVVEPGGAVALAAALQGRIATRERTIAIVASGGNVDPEPFADALRSAPA